MQLFRDILEAILTEILEQTDRYNTNELTFQQDRAFPPRHYINAIRQYLNITFPGRRISRKGSVVWPAGSLDLSPIDFFR